MIRHIITLLTLIFSLNFCFGRTSIYFNTLNNFQSIAIDNIIDGKLVDDNKTTEQIFRIYPINLVDNDCRFEIRFANIHNDEYKSYTAINPTTGKKTKIANPIWGIVWNFVDKNNHHKLTLQCHNSNRHDILDQRYMSLKVIRVCNGVATALHESKISNNISLHSDFNVVALNSESNVITIRIGNNELRPICTLNNENSGINSIGYFVGAGAKVVIERATLDYEPQMEKSLVTDWTIDRLNSYFAKSNDVREGYWEYLDRDIDETKLRLGGRYKIALIKTEIGYDILYINGGKVNESKWKCGMIKGRLINTQFVDSFTLNWNDAMMKQFTVDVHARFIDNSILELNFPIQKSTLRFSKTY